MRRTRSTPVSRPLDAAALRALAMGYVGKYATTRAKLTSYLDRKVRERGWAGEGDIPISDLVTYCVEAGFVDDGAFAEARAAALGRRGFGAGRVTQALRQAGVALETVAALTPTEAEAVAAAERFARRRRIGPYGDGNADAALRRRQFAAMVRAGHSFELARQFVDNKHAPDRD